MIGSKRGREKCKIHNLRRKGTSGDVMLVSNPVHKERRFEEKPRWNEGSGDLRTTS